MPKYFDDNRLIKKLIRSYLEDDDLCHDIDTHGKYSNPQAQHLHYDAVIRNHERYLQYGIYKSIWKLVLLFQILQLIAQRPIASIYEKIQSVRQRKSMRNENPWQTCVVNVHFVGCTQPGPKGPA